MKLSTAATVLAMSSAAMAFAPITPSRAAARTGTSLAIGTGFSPGGGAGAGAGTSYGANPGSMGTGGAGGTGGMGGGSSYGSSGMGGGMQQQGRGMGGNSSYGSNNGGNRGGGFGSMYDTGKEKYQGGNGHDGLNPERIRGERVWSGWEASSVYDIRARQQERGVWVSNHNRDSNRGFNREFITHYYM